MRLFLWSSSRGNVKQSLALVLIAFLLLPLCPAFAQDATDQQSELTAQAQSQFEAGDWGEAFATAGSLASDTERAELLNDLAQQRAESQQEYRQRFDALAGGISASDFTSLVNLVTTTVSPDSWAVSYTHLTLPTKRIV